MSLGSARALAFHARVKRTRQKAHRFNAARAVTILGSLGWLARTPGRRVTHVPSPTLYTNRHQPGVWENSCPDGRNKRLLQGLGSGVAGGVRFRRSVVRALQLFPDLTANNRSTRYHSGDQWGTTDHAKRAQIVLANPSGVVPPGGKRRAVRIRGPNGMTGLGFGTIRGRLSRPRLYSLQADSTAKPRPIGGRIDVAQKFDLHSQPSTQGGFSCALQL
jgi:hypothetical protein